MTKSADPLADRCVEIADLAVPNYRLGERSYSCGGTVAKRWQAAFDAAHLAFTGPQPAQHAPAPIIEQWTCATRHLGAERALQIIERGVLYGRIDHETIALLGELVDDAGPAYARIAIAHVHLDDEIPF